MAFAKVMQREMDEILAHPLFANAPTLSRLLRYLVSETLAGRGHMLKGYSVAVDGLGRSPDFDAQTDSYPRVQIGRLRRALETYYAQRAPTAGSCLYLQQGSYLVRLAAIGRAYPQLVSAQALAEPPQIIAELDAAAAEAPLPDRERARRWPRGAIVAAAVAALVVVGTAYLLRDGPAAATAAQSPIIAIEDFANAGGNVTPGPANDAYGLLVDGISKSWVVRVRLDGSRQSDASQYRLRGRIGAVDQGRSPLYLTLADAAGGALLWSSTIAVSPNSIADDLAPTISRLAGPYGVIAANETRRRAGSFAPGYPCLLQYLGYVTTRDPALEDRVGACLAQPSPETQLEAVRLAYRATYPLKNSRDGTGTEAALRAAGRHAAAAVAADPKQAYAQFARARIAFIRQDCATGAKAARLAVEHNPYDPTILAVLGGMMDMCGLADGRTMLERAYRYREVGQSQARLPLILVAIRNGKMDWLRTLSEARRPSFGASLAYHYLCETMISAGLGDYKAARGHWGRFVHASGRQGASVDRQLQFVILSPPLRARITGYLQFRGILEAVDDTAGIGDASKVSP